MKKIVHTFFSMLSSIILLSLFAFSIGYATFLENDKGTELAKNLIYNAVWFDCLFLLLFINLTGSVFRYRLVQKRKWSILLFHLAFSFIILGAAVTRFTGFEGLMHIRQGETSDEITLEKTSVKVLVERQGVQVEKTMNVLFSAQEKNNYSETVQIGGKTISVEQEYFLIFKVSDGKTEKRVNLLNSENGTSRPGVCLIDGVKVTVTYGMLPHKLPFSITLQKFILDRYPGSNSPSSYASEITLMDNERHIQIPFRIFMNNILKYRGYRFYQSSYDPDEMGTVLSVSHDYWGTFTSYLGYLLMLIGMVLTLFNKNSRFRNLMKLSKDVQLLRKTAKIGLLPVFLSVAMGLQAADISKKDHLKQLDRLFIQDEVQGRIEPFNTYSSDLLRKISKETSYDGLLATEVLLGMISDPEHWKNEPLIKISNPQLGKELGAVNEHVSFNQLFDFDNDGQYRLTALVEQAYQKEQVSRNKYDKEVINLDERVNICYQIFSGMMLTVFPIVGSVGGKWSPAVAVDSTGGLLNAYFLSVRKAQQLGIWQDANETLSRIKKYQLQYGGSILPSKGKIQLEIFYNTLNIFGKLAILYMLLGVFLLVLHLMIIYKCNAFIDKVLSRSVYLLIAVFAVFTLGLMMRWYLSGHAPWSNGYETIVFVGWASGLAGLFFVKRSPVTLAVTSVLSAVALFVAGMSWMNPEITNLVPVLKSYWLVLHVAVITSSYGFFAMAALMGLFNLVLMISRTKNNLSRLSESIKEYSYIIEIALYIGLIMLTVGTFLGGVWANESWGRYWGWDPKETWALVSILVYAIVLHLRNIPVLNNQLVLSTLALLSFGTVLMTFFGVNYYLSGMHSYAQGTPPPVPFGLYIGVVCLLLIVGFALSSERKVKSWKKEN
jgi:cytochrome c-type biogenesis protein CcsB